MNNLVGGIQKYKISQMNSELPFIQNRKQIRAISLQQIFDKVQSNCLQIEFNPQNLANLKPAHKISSNHLNYDNHPQTERSDTKLRSQSMTNRLQRSKGSETILSQVDSKNTGNKKYTYGSNNSDSIQKQRIHLKKFDNNKQLRNDRITSFFQLKMNKQNDSDQKFNNLMHSTNNLLSQISERTNLKKIHLNKQNDIDTINPAGPLLSFRQFAKLQGFKLPSFLHM
ncbi:unnamed protein product (macronuclear) [Paramecium tetraurelia]|uniref:Uncharacterized protein n=1 Tax=Paramecium tetraurelia TaxID=5888 RepID=A0DGN0_PARTE|nr:uncharacterized protein GSPATT00002326001 [Paramecium tetraurelia]CAK82197.1 unnamed protein product [Paramecium tetraurelia]|eukprot:XP_001449594.1 hypothetical protein (macronuclear) [Paramecium tetraurelia strain d4-2]